MLEATLRRMQNAARQRQHVGLTWAEAEELLKERDALKLALRAAKASLERPEEQELRDAALLALRTPEG